MHKSIYQLWLVLFFLGLLITPLNASLLEDTLKDGVGIRPLAMGGAFVALADDASAIFYNPAGLYSDKFSYLHGEVDLKKSEYLLNNYNLYAFKRFGAGFIKRENLVHEIVEVSTYTYGRRGKNRISWGFSYKEVKGRLSSGSFYGKSFDAGLLMPLSSAMNLGMVLYDVFTDGVEVPTSLRVGLGVPRRRSLGYGIDLEARNLRSERGADLFFHYGLEFLLTDGLLLRGGWQKDQLCAGVGVVLPFGAFDYAMTISSDSNSENIHSLGVRFGQ